MKLNLTVELQKNFKLNIKELEVFKKFNYEINLDNNILNIVLNVKLDNLSEAEGEIYRFRDKIRYETLTYNKNLSNS